jgi:uncharacterized protein
MNRRGLMGFLGGAVGVLSMIRPAAAQAPEKTGHRIAIQVSSNDAATMNLALNNTKNLFDDFAKSGAAAMVEIVTYGPGLHMLRADTSPVAERIASFVKSMPNLRFSACNNTKMGMEKAEGKEITLLPAAVVVPSGAVRLVERQEEGWSYIRP